MRFRLLVNCPALPELIGVLLNAAVITRTGRRSHRLGQAAKADDGRATKVVAVALANKMARII